MLATRLHNSMAMTGKDAFWKFAKIALPAHQEHPSAVAALALLSAVALVVVEASAAAAVSGDVEALEEEQVEEGTLGLLQ